MTTGKEAAVRLRAKNKRHRRGLKMTEEQLQSCVQQMLDLCGWLSYHTYDSRKSAPGFPDIVAVRDGVVLFAELKTDVGELSLFQRQWLDELEAAGQTVYVWRTSDWLDGRIEKVIASARR